VTRDLLSAGAPPMDTLETSIELRIEPTLSCELRCPVAHGNTKQNDAWVPGFSIRRFSKTSSRTAFGVGSMYPGIVYLGLGEPLEHPNFPELCNLAMKIAPNAIHELGTNGNPLFLETVRDSQLDRIIVGDGVRQSSYEKYRIRGSVSRALQFMRDERKYATNNRFIEWKYILFEFNDSDEELIEAQKWRRDRRGLDYVYRHSVQVALEKIPIRET
jgi:hypothetical protein